MKISREAWDGERERRNGYEPLINPRYNKETLQLDQSPASSAEGLTFCARLVERSDAKSNLDSLFISMTHSTVLKAMKCTIQKNRLF